VYVKPKTLGQLVSGVCERGVASCDTACTIYTVPHSVIYVPFWLLGVAGADLRPDIIINEQLARAGYRVGARADRNA
jgi:hypothetical protein